VACPACDCARRLPVESDVPDLKYGVAGLWSFVRCADCGLVYLAETLTDAALGYPSTYSQHRRPGSLRLDGRWSVRRDVRGALLEQMGYRVMAPPVMPRALAGLALAVPQLRLRAAWSLLLVPPAHAGGTLLDVGCGNGRFLAIMHALGWHVHGIEPDERSAELARQSSGARVDAELDEELYGPGYFDVITMNHVLEHVADPAPVLQRCFRLCSPGGLIGITVPNWLALGHRVFGRHWYALEPPRHAIMYEPATLERVMEQAGFEVAIVRTTSVREWAVSWRTSWRFRTGRRSPAILLGAWGLATSVASLVGNATGEEIFAWARKP
jgi:2-polyprenyl-3-methyl-5-hydroxy-6-metoxy-1,4-benzoquinol methylase